MFDEQKHKENIMRVLELTSEEADAVIAYDKAVDQGKKTEYDLTEEQKKQTRKYRQADRKRDFTFQKRERKPNEPKRELIELFHNTLLEIADSVEVTNIERQIDFVVDGVRYRLVLSAPRK